MTTDTPPSALDAREARLRALKAGKQPPGSDGYLGKEIDLMLALDQDALPIIDHYKAEAASLRAQLAEARAEVARERENKDAGWSLADDRRLIIDDARTQVAALLAEREEARKLLDQAHRTECPTCRDDGTCVGCIVGDFLGVSDDARAALDKAARTATKETPDYEKRVHLETGVGRPAKVVRAAPPTDKGEG